MKKKLVCIGDSHASFFSGIDNRQVEYPEESINTIPNLEGVRLGAVLAYSLHRLNSSTRGREKLFDKLSKCDKNTCSVLFCFGEIDCRYYLLKKAEERNLSIQEVVKDCVDKYFSVVLEVKDLGFEVLIWNVIPTSKINTNKEYPNFGSHEQRNLCTKYFNAVLEEKCKQHNIGFIDIFNKLITKKNITKDYYLFDGIHLAQLAMPYFIGQIRKSYPHIQMGYSKKFAWPFLLAKKIVIFKLRETRNKSREIKKTFLQDIRQKYFQLKRKLAAPKEILPYEEKRKLLDHYRTHFSLNTLVETGTFVGDTAGFLKNKYKFVYSIELSEGPAARPIKRFASDDTVKILQGDGSKILSDLAKQITTPALFWLDGHYSSQFFVNGEFIKTAKSGKDTSIEEELITLMNSPLQHVILIDDARLFNGQGDYPSIHGIKKIVSKSKYRYEVKIEKDIISILPIS